MAEKEIGKVTHYFTNIGVGVIELTGKLKVGDKIKIKGASTDFEQMLNSMQVDKQAVQEAKKGDSIGVKFDEKVREGDLIFIVE